MFEGHGGAQPAVALEPVDQQLGQMHRLAARIRKHLGRSAAAEQSTAAAAAAAADLPPGATSAAAFEWLALLEAKDARDASGDGEDPLVHLELRDEEPLRAPPRLRDPSSSRDPPRSTQVGPGDGRVQQVLGLVERARYAEETRAERGLCFEGAQRSAPLGGLRVPKTALLERVHEALADAVAVAKQKEDECAHDGADRADDGAEASVAAAQREVGTQGERGFVRIVGDLAYDLATDGSQGGAQPGDTEEKNGAAEYAEGHIHHPAGRAAQLDRATNVHIVQPKNLVLRARV